MFRTKLTLAGLAVAAAVGAAAPTAIAEHDSWYAYATSLTGTQQSGPDSWHGYAVSLTNAQRSAPFITDTLAPGGKAPAESPRFITDTLAPGGKTPAQGYRFITDTLAPGGGTSSVPAPVAGGFNWGDAGIGAASIAGIVLALLGSLRAVATRRRMVAA